MKPMYKNYFLNQPWTGKLFDTMSLKKQIYKNYSVSKSNAMKLWNHIP